MGCRHSLLCSPGIGDEGLQGAQLPSHGMQRRQEAGSHCCHSERRETNLAAPGSQERPLVNPHSATTCPVLMAPLPRRCPDADIRGVFIPGGGKAPPCQLQVRTACLPPPLPLLLIPRKLPSPPFLLQPPAMFPSQDPDKTAGPGKGRCITFCRDPICLAIF